MPTDLCFGNPRYNGSLAPGFLERYAAAMPGIAGWFSFDAALLFMAFRQLARDSGGPNVLEIGVHHGLSTIAVAALRGPGGRLVAIDLFDEGQEQNVSKSGQGNRAIFRRNMNRFYTDLRFVEEIARPSGELTRADIGSDFGFCHIDGGHSRAETYGDVRLCAEVLVPGGLLAVDDYFNPEFPGVGEGVAQFMIGSPGTLVPVAIGFNKVLFRKRPFESDLTRAFRVAFPHSSHREVTMWDAPALYFTHLLRETITQRGTEVVSARPDVDAVFQPAAPTVRVRPGEHVVLPVAVDNTSSRAWPAGKDVFGLAYHVRSDTGRELLHDGRRTWIERALAPGERIDVDLVIEAPAAPGTYQIEIDLVEEGVRWFRDSGNPTVFVELTAE